MLSPEMVLDAAIVGPDRRCTMLIVEDNRADVVLLKRALSMAGVVCDPVVARDGQEAIDYLKQNFPTGDPAIPLLLDLKLPRMSGLELLSWIRSSTTFRHFPVIVLSSSNLESDIDQARRFGVDAYLIKPGSMREFVQTATEIAKIWGLPQSPPAA